MSLSTYTQKAFSNLLSETGAFYAFSNQQFAEQQQPGIQYTSLGAGLIVPSSNAKKLVDGMEMITEAGIAQDLKENSKNDIILRELNNFECFYTSDISDCCDALEGYNISRDEIYEVFLANQHL